MLDLWIYNIHLPRSSLSINESFFATVAQDFTTGMSTPGYFWYFGFKFNALIIYRLKKQGKFCENHELHDISKKVHLAFL